jgi:hypothetical protein
MMGAYFFYQLLIAGKVKSAHFHPIINYFFSNLRISILEKSIELSNRAR